MAHSDASKVPVELPVYEMQEAGFAHRDLPACNRLPWLGGESPPPSGPLLRRSLTFFPVRSRQTVSLETGFEQGTRRDLNAATFGYPQAGPTLYQLSYGC